MLKVFLFLVSMFELRDTEYGEMQRYLPFEPPLSERESDARNVPRLPSNVLIVPWMKDVWVGRVCNFTVPDTESNLLRQYPTSYCVTSH
jgi:hypothetical protein